MSITKGPKVFSEVKKCLDGITSKILREQIYTVLRELEKKLFERNTVWKKCVVNKNKEIERWKSAFKAKEKELKNIKNKKTDLILLSAYDSSGIGNFLI